MGDSGHLTAQEQSTLAENTSFEAVDNAGSEQCSSPQHQQETSRVQEKNQPQASGSWTPYNTKNYWEQDDDKCHWESGGAQGNGSSKWVEASGDSSWEWPNWSWDSTKTPWAKEQNKQHIRPYKEGAHNQLCSSEINKNCRKTWVPTEKLRPSQSPLPTALTGDTAVQTPDGSSVQPPPGLGPGSEVGHAAASCNEGGSKVMEVGHQCSNSHGWKPTLGSHPWSRKILKGAESETCPGQGPDNLMKDSKMPSVQRFR